jgi:hypothetical protein
MTRSATFRISSAESPDSAFEHAVEELTALTYTLTKQGRDAFLGVSADIEYADEHPERDALLALADKWRTEVIGPETCADQLVRLLATLSL